MGNFVKIVHVGLGGRIVVYYDLSDSGQRECMSKNMEMYPVSTIYHTNEWHEPEYIVTDR